MVEHALEGVRYSSLAFGTAAVAEVGCAMSLLI